MASIGHFPVPEGPNAAKEDADTHLGLLWIWMMMTDNPRSHGGSTHVLKEIGRAWKIPENNTKAASLDLLFRGFLGGILLRGTVEKK